MFVFVSKLIRKGIIGPGQGLNKMEQAYLLNAKLRSGLIQLYYNK